MTILTPRDAQFVAEARRVLEQTRERYPWTRSAFDLPQQVANYVQTTLASSMTNVSTTMTLTSVAGFPTAGNFRCVIKDAAPATTYEIVEVASVNVGAGIMTFTTPLASGRGLEGTTAIAHSSGAFVSNDITAYMLSAYSAQGVGNLGSGSVAYAQVVATQTVAAGGTLTDITGLTVTVTVPAARMIRITAYSLFNSTTADGQYSMQIREGSTTLQVGSTEHSAVVSANLSVITQVVLVAPTAASHTYKASMQKVNGTGNFVMGASTIAPAWILVEDIGPAT